MKKILMAIPYFLFWVLYFLVTQEARNRYMLGKAKGYHCTRIEHGKGFFGDASDAYFNTGKKPEREYITWREFWQTRKHWN